MQCSHCSFDNPQDFRYCGRCGAILDREAIRRTDLHHHQAERRNVTILFSDLSDYTRITETFDAEDVKAIMAEIFDKSRRIILNYGGSVERFLGDEVMAIFGSPVSHEDDAIRAINAAREIHRTVDVINDRQLIDHPLKMHTGINTGIVITSENRDHRLSYGVTGDAANLAKRIQTLAQPGEILVGNETYRQSAGYFNFHSLDIQPVRGHNEAVFIYRYISHQQEPRKVRRIFGRRSKLIGREREIAVFEQAARGLEKSGTKVVCVSGEMGTGKSRLTDEFKKGLEKEKFTWCEGSAYEFTRNSSYFPIIDLLRREFDILEEDPPGTIRSKVADATIRWAADTGLADLIGGLFALESMETAAEKLIDPEIWKSRLHDAMATLFNAMASHKPMIVCFEDLHWADSSTIDLLVHLITQCQGPILFLLIYRPLFSDQYPNLLTAAAKDATLLSIGELSPEQSGRMVCSLLDTPDVPQCLLPFVENEIPGNPFFLEEVINSLVESETIVQSGETWELKQPIYKLEIALTIRGVITSRIDRLEPEARGILREASVIGSSFPAEILLVISRSSDRLDQCLENLVQLDLLRIKRQTPLLEYNFKHVLIREVVYDGLLKSERQAIHTRIALCIEKLFCENLPEHYETLAYHFREGGDINKAITYLMHSGRKSLRRYAVEDSHRYYQEAFTLIKGLKGSKGNHSERLVETMANWFPVFYYRGRFGTAQKLMDAHLALADALENAELRGMFYIGYGMCLWARERFGQAYDIMHKALAIGETTGHRKVEGYAHAWLTWVCIEIGLPQEALAHGRAARSLAAYFDSGHYPYYRSWDSDGLAYWGTGDCNGIRACSNALLEYGKANASRRVKTWSRFIMGLGHLTDGDFTAAVKDLRRAHKAASDPLYTMFPKLFMGIAAIGGGDYFAMRQDLKEVMDHGQRYGCEVISTPADFFLSISRCIDGNIRQNISNIKRITDHWNRNRAHLRVIVAELILGEFYLNIRLREIAMPLPVIFRNLPFLMVALPLAAGRCLYHYRNAIDLARKAGARSMEGQAYLGMARLFHRQKKTQKAREAIDRALKLFRDCGAQTYTRQAQDLKSGFPAS